ncbi:MAG: hypothetical protein LBV02_03980 [Bacteroidales bacterium]|jgi:hypothetical protein|nr:hypothetical protein [Bacteroidales bacterium]
MSSTKYNPKSHFFVDHAVLGEPEEADAFGPVTMMLDSSLTPPALVSTNPEIYYRTTSFVRADTANPAKVFAICDGRILLQPVEGKPAKVNLVLKPEVSYSPLKIKYFIYRELDKADLIDGDNALVPIDGSNANQPAFLKRLWEAFESYNASIPGTMLPIVFNADRIGYDALELPESMTIDGAFNRYESGAYQLPRCDAGMQLGRFSERIGLDIILDDGDYQQEYLSELFLFDLAYARKSEHVFDISTISAPTPTKTARYRELVLRFLDAAAFWGSHIKCGSIALHDAGAIGSTERIYSDILRRYRTKDTVCIHILAERGRSYNYYDMPGSKRGLSFELSLKIPTDYCETSGWPILLKKYDAQQEENTIHGIMQSEVDPSIANETERFTALDIIAPGLGGQRFPQKYAPGIKRGVVGPLYIDAWAWEGKVCASFVFINACLTQVFPVPGYFNELWPADAKPAFAIPVDGADYTSWCAYGRSRIVNLGDALSTGAVIQNKVVFDTGKNAASSPAAKKRRLFVAALKDNTTHDTELDNLNVECFTSCFDNGLRYEDYTRHLYGDGFSVYRGTFADGAEVVNSLCLFHEKNLWKRKSFFQLGMTEDEHGAVMGALPAGADNVFFHLEELPFYNPPGSGATGPPGSENVRKFKLGLSCENDSGSIDILFPATDIAIYSLDGCYFFSKGYAAYQTFYSEFAKARVEFRPVPDASYPPIPKYNGEFGFDWLRTGDNTAGTNDPPYANIILNGGYERPKTGDGNT